jgi:molecular chaperone GrpE (heat shock protein)
MVVPAWAVKLQHEMQTCFAETVGQILHAFEQKLVYDRGKEEQISRLHEELQTYKANLLAKTNRPFIIGLIRMHDDLAKVGQDIRQRETESLTPEKVAELLEGFQEDIEILLEQHGVAAYREQAERFDPRRQMALRTVPTGAPDQVGIIASPLRPGFEQDGTIVQKERVAVYALSKELLEPNKSEGQDVSAEGGGDQKGAGSE